jgi:hypothetical protein
MPRRAVGPDPDFLQLMLGTERKNLLVLRRKLALPAKRWIVGTVSGIFGSGDETIHVQDELAGGGRHVASVLSVGVADLRE